MPSFDVVSEVDLQEARNALDQALREIGTRFDFKGTHTTLEWDNSRFLLAADDEFKLGQARDILYLRLAKRGIELAALKPGAIEGGVSGRVRQSLEVRQGIDAETGRRLSRALKDSKLKVQVAIQGEQLRVTGKKRDDLQQAIAALKKAGAELPLQFTNFRD